MSFEHWWYVLRLRLRSLFRRGTVEQELDDELRYHLERQIEVDIARGMTPAAARAAALRAMGSLEARKDECRDQRGVSMVDHTLRDLRHAVRLLRRSPAFTAVAIGSLALGIGANAALFQLIERVQVRSLGVRSPGELAEIRVAAFGILASPMASTRKSPIRSGSRFVNTSRPSVASSPGDGSIRWWAAAQTRGR